MMTIDQLLSRMDGMLQQERANTDLENSIINIVKQQGVTIQTLSQQLALAGTDPTKLQKLSDMMETLAAEQMSQNYAAAAARAAMANTSADPDKPQGDTGQDTQTGNDTVLGADTPLGGDGDDSLKGGSGDDTARAAGAASADPEAKPVGQAGAQPDPNAPQSQASGAQQAAPLSPPVQQ